MSTELSDRHGVALTRVNVGGHRVGIQLTAADLHLDHRVLTSEQAREIAADLLAAADLIEENNTATEIREILSDALDSDTA